MRNKGLVINGVNNLAYKDAAPDLGAYEYFPDTVTINISLTKRDTASTKDTAKMNYSNTQYVLSTIVDSVLTSDTVIQCSIQTYPTSTLLIDSIFLNDTLVISATIYFKDSVSTNCVQSIYDTTIIYYTVTGIVPNDKNSFSIYPNPSTGIIEIRGLDQSLNCYLRLHDMLGKMVLEIKDTLSLNLHDLPNGIYVLEVCQEKIQAFFKVVKW